MLEGGKVFLREASLCGPAIDVEADAMLKYRRTTKMFSVECRGFWCEVQKIIAIDYTG